MSPAAEDPALARAQQTHDDAICALKAVPIGEVPAEVLTAHAAKAAALAQLSIANAVMELVSETREIRKELRRGRR
ncbi:hypothetical protein [Nocardiopsis suaedae]|uniref:HNH endonuclease n=1 Tax=Nocardiopsis suaedae TaxID=3018444 RepID=A0ABT4TLX8_9ACTN|nr:hypothetical protein [Nocardiopsis suaedae]MDA2805705.1 hypothetical protein [Nocardiopsis suaedae]